MKELAAIKTLQSLCLGSTHVTDAGLKELTVLDDLQELDISTTDVTDVGMKEVARKTQTALIFLPLTQVCSLQFALLGSDNKTIFYTYDQEGLKYS